MTVDEEVRYKVMIAERDRAAEIAKTLLIEVNRLRLLLGYSTRQA